LEKTPNSGEFRLTYLVLLTLTTKSLNASSDSFDLRHTTKNCNPTQGRDDNNQQRHDDVFQHDDSSVKATSGPETKINAIPPVARNFLSAGRVMTPTDCRI
jgi:hypothetical protein